MLLEFEDFMSVLFSKYTRVTPYVITAVSSIANSINNKVLYELVMLFPVNRCHVFR